ncbi:cytochrome P450 [Ideonella sp. A 288]|uniref:cytochrome P450 n=1 Tax=Ideonella sp. A 288 TaxID=1962181 RepID=UPI000B4AD260|nr:cytochrome P450 [Ideonella sp. A 288]
MHRTAHTTRQDDPPAPLRDIASLPGPRGVPVVGNGLQIDLPRFHRQLEGWAHEFGTSYRLRLRGSDILVIADHAQVAQVLRDRPDGFRRTSRLEEIGREMGLKPGVFGVNGEAWRRQRRMVMAGFDPAHVRSYFPSLLRVTQRLGQRWQQAARDGLAIDLQADLMRYTVDAIAGLAFGAEVDTLSSDEDVIQRHLDKIFPALFSRAFAAFPVWRWVKRPADRELERSMAEVNAAVAGFIAQARARLQADPALRERPNNLLEAMVVAADQPDSGLGDDEVAGNVMTMLLAGEDTTANTLAWMIHLLVRHPDALARATDEVRRLAPEPAALTMEQMAGLDWVEACAHETMRLKPVAPMLTLQALHDTALGDVRVPAGGVVLCLFRHDSVSEQHVEQATTFDPARWMADGGPAQQASSARRISMPFGAGPRICPGRYLALLEIKMAIALLLGRFEILSVDTPDGLEPPERLSFTMAPVGLKMRLRERG